MSVKHLWSNVQTNETLMKYFPTYAEGKIQSSKFFFGVSSMTASCSLGSGDGDAWFLGQCYRGMCDAEKHSPR